MATVVEKYAARRKGQPLFISDFSPPRGATQGYIEDAKKLGVDFICVAYNPGKSVRVSSAIAAYAIKKNTGKDVIFNLSTRDMNRLATQSYLLGAQVLGLENLVVMRGDDFTQQDLARVKAVGDFKPTELIRAVKDMNRGLDFRGLKLSAPTSFCVGASIDLSKGIEREARLAHKKASAGADFFIAQAIYDADLVKSFLDAHTSIAVEELSQPVFYGVQILSKENVVFFGGVPEWMRRDLDRGRQGTDIALELLQHLLDKGITTIYLIPPILKGGVRDYAAAQRVLEAFRSGKVQGT